jgi:hypothetical protein
MDFFDPTGTQTAEQAHGLAPALSHVDGLHVGLLDNNKTNAANFLRIVAERLIANFQVGSVSMVAKPALSKPAPDEVLDELESVADFIVIGIGDCGSCSTCCVHDGIELEKRGVPAVAVCTEAFVPGLTALAAMRGMPDYPYAVVPHPLGVLADEELGSRADLAVPQIVEIVTNHPLRPQGGATV